MASRYDATSTTGKGRTRRSAPAAAAVVVLGAALGMVTPQSGFAAGPDAILLPNAEARQLDAGIAGWTAGFAVTATGCGVAPCPSLSAGWQAGVGARGATDGALGVTLSGVAGRAGVAVATLRSPVFLAPASPGSADAGVAVRSIVATGDPDGAASTVAVRLLDVATGARRTIVDSTPAGVVGAPWTDVRGENLESGALRPLGAYRIELEVRFRFAADAAADTTVLLDRPTLAVQELPADSPGGAAEPQAPIGATGPLQLDTAPAGDDGTDGSDAGTDDQGRCEQPLTILGAAADGARLTIVGAADAAPGTAVDLWTADGWHLGRSAVTAAGTFSGRFRAPAAAGRARLVVARTLDGEASGPVAVGRRNVVRSLRRVGSTIVVDGVVARSWPAGRRRAKVELGYGAGDCAEPEVVRVGTAQVGVDGRYRLVLRPGGPGYREVRGAQVVSARLTRPDGPGAPREFHSPLTAVPPSDT